MIEVNDIDEMLRLAQDEGLHMRGLQILMLLRTPRYSNEICEVLGIRTGNLPPTVGQIKRYIKTSGPPDSIQQRWKVYSLNKRGEKFVKRLLNA